MRLLLILIFCPFLGFSQMVVDAFKFESATNDNYALHFDPCNDYTENVRQNIISTDYSAFDLTGDWTIEFRHYNESTAWDGGFPFYVEIFTTTSNEQVRILLATTSRAIFDLYPSGTRRFIYPGSITGLQDTWKHFLISYESGVGLNVWVDGTKYSLSFTEVFTGTTNQVNLYGRGAGNQINPQGYSRGFRFFTAAIDDTQAADLYNSNAKTMQAVPAGLVASLKKELLFNQISGRTVIDSSVTGANETLSDIVTEGNPYGWSDADVAEGGGAWVDVSGL